MIGRLGSGGLVVPVVRFRAIGPMKQLLPRSTPGFPSSFTRTLMFSEAAPVRGLSEPVPACVGWIRAVRTLVPDFR